MKREEAIATLTTIFVPETYINILAEIETKPQTIRALSKKVGITEAVLYRRFTFLKEHRLVYVAKWQKNTEGYLVPLYRIGSENDTPKPKNTRMTAAEKCRRWRERGGDPARSRKLKALIANPPKLGMFGV